MKAVKRDAKMNKKKAQCLEKEGKKKRRLQRLTDYSKVLCLH